MAIANSEWGTRIDEVEDRIYRINTKTPARSLASSGGHCLRSLVFAHSALRPRVSWAFNWVADAKWSATAFPQVGSCLRHTLLASWRQRS